MTSFAQFEANRRNALRSTGPKTDEGKRRSRLNAIRHGLTVETVVASLEDAEDYEAFEATIIADYHAETAVARELVLRLASLLWRLRRANAVETDLLEIQAGLLRKRLDTSGEELQPNSVDDVPGQLHGATRQLTVCFLRLANLESGVFERLNRYEARLWRQTVQTLFALHPVCRKVRCHRSVLHQCNRERNFICPTRF
jgi:hypothetical protein